MYILKQCMLSAYGMNTRMIQPQHKQETKVPPSVFYLGSYKEVWGGTV